MRQSIELKQHAGRWLFPLILVATLFQSYHDLSALLSDGQLALFRYEGSIIDKVGKDIIYALLFIEILRTAKKRHTLPLVDFSVALGCLIFALVSISIISNGLVIAMLGLRWATPFILFLMLRDWSKALDRNNTIHWLIFGMIICLGAQIYQIFNMPPVFGEFIFGIPARTPGIFIAPNAGAFFACASAALVVTLKPSGRKSNFLVVVLALIISTLAQSGTGIITSLVLLLYLFCERSPIMFLGLALLTLVATLSNLNVLIMREDYVEISGGGRVDVLIEIARSSIFSVSNFGVFTNAGNLMNENPEDKLSPDSLIASWIGNFGFLSPLTLILTVFFVKYRMKSMQWWVSAPCIVVFILFSLTTITFEAFPMNIYIAIGLWSARRSTALLKN